MNTKWTWLPALVGVFWSCIARPAGAQIWFATGSPTNGWADVACSVDGSTVVAARWQDGIYVSSDFGSNWIKTSAPPLVWNRIVVPADATKIAALTLDGLIYTSTNGGLAWTQSSIPSNWGFSIACSASGNMLFAASSGTLTMTISSNWGQTWSVSSPTSAIPCQEFAVSADGSQLVAAGAETGVFLSTDGGSSWTNAGLPSSYYWQSVRISADGSRMAALSDAGNIYVSTNSGKEWWSVSNSFIPVTWLYLAASTNLATLAAVGYLGPVNLSTDFGQTWQTTVQPRAVMRITSSGDGRTMYIVQWGGSIYTLRPGPALTASLVAGQWVLTSPDYLYSRYTLQQNSDLRTTNWTTVTNLPLSTNGVAQLTLPPSPGATFFRFVP